MQLRRENYAQVDTILKQLVDEGLGGVEVIHSDHSELDIREIERLAERLLFEHKVVVSPGEAFGPRSAGFIRLSYAASDDDLAEGLTRLEAGLAAAREG